VIGTPSGPAGAIIVTMSPRPAAPRRVLPGSPFQAPVVVPPEHFTVGERVTHDRHGMGTVVGVEDGDVAVLVKFGGGVVQRITLPNTKISKL
jgi:hypothetical protein